MQSVFLINTVPISVTRLLKHEYCEHFLQSVTVKLECVHLVRKSVCCGHWLSCMIYPTCEGIKFVPCEHIGDVTFSVRKQLMKATKVRTMTTAQVIFPFTGWTWESQCQYTRFLTRKTGCLYSHTSGQPRVHISPVIFWPLMQRVHFRPVCSTSETYWLPRAAIEHREISRLHEPGMKHVSAARFVIHLQARIWRAAAGALSTCP